MSVMVRRLTMSASFRPDIDFKATLYYHYVRSPQARGAGGPG